MSSRQRRRRRTKHEARRNSQKRRLVAAGGLTAGATLAVSGVAHAAPTTFTVGTTADPGSVVSDCTSPSNVDCSLREAISEANANADADTIVFRSGLSGAINLTAGQLEITDALTVQGPGASLMKVDAGLNSRIIYAHTKYGDPVSISGLTLARGSSAESGAGIRNFQGDLTISDAVITGSTTAESGGAIYLYHGSLLVDSSTLSGNTAARYGGGVYFDDSDDTGQSVIRNSTISGNTVYGDGGGVYVSDSETQGPILIHNTTVVGNHAGDSVSDNGGGVYDFSDPPVITIDSSTITGNSTTNGGGGIFFQHGNTIRNSIVSGNTADNPHDTYGPDVGTRGDGLPIETAFDLIGDPSGPAIDELVSGSNVLGADPQLGPLQDNGGATQTRLPASTSPAINKGNAFSLTTDQRGLTRPVAFPGVANSTAAGADGADIGAVELQQPSPTPSPPGAAQTSAKKCKKKKKHKRSADSAKKKHKKCKKKKKRR
jgi:parallel beta-helix repeat protein